MWGFAANPLYLWQMKFGCMEDIYTVGVGDETEFSLGPQSAASLDLVKTGEDTHHLIHGGKGYRVSWPKADFHKGLYVVEIEGRRYETWVKTPLDGLIQRMGLAGNGNRDIDAILAPMPGLLLEVLVQEGDKVEKGDRLLVLEAMKMENIISSPRAGTIKKIHQGQGATVDKKQLLLEFE